MTKNDLTDLGVTPAMASMYMAVNHPAPQQVSDAASGSGYGNPNDPNSPANNAPVAGPPPGGNTGSAAAASQGTTTAGPAKPGQAGYLNVPTTEGGPATPPPSVPTDQPTDPHLLDWEQTLLQWGFTQDEIDGIYKTYSAYADPAQGQQAALAYARGTDTYKRLFPGIQQGEKIGLFGDEASYRQYVNAMNESSNRYLGRATTTQEVLDWINGGRTAAQFEQHLGGGAYITANKNDIQYALGNFGDQGAQQATPDQLSALGDNTMGLNNLTGTVLQQKLDKARARLADIFNGQLASPSLAVLNGGGVANSSSAAAGRPADIAS